MAKLEISYSLKKPMLFNSDFIGQFKAEIQTQDVDITRTDNWNMIAEIKNEGKVNGYLKKKVTTTGVTEKALNALDADTNRVSIKYNEDVANRRYSIVAICTSTHADTTKRLVKYLEERFRDIYPSYGNAAAAQGTSRWLLRRYK